MCLQRRVMTLMAAISLVLASATTSYAAPFTFDVTVDLAGASIDDIVLGGNPGRRISFDADFPDIDEFFVADTLHLNISFANGALLRLADLGAPFLGDAERIVGRTVLQGTFRASDRHDLLAFTGVQGNLLVNPFGTDNFSNDINLTDTEFGVSGLALDLTFSNPVFDPDLPIFASLVAFEFEFWADDISVRADEAVPEPATITLVLLGLAAFARRQRTAGSEGGRGGREARGGRPESHKGSSVNLRQR